MAKKPNRAQKHLLRANGIAIPETRAAASKLTRRILMKNQARPVESKDVLIAELRVQVRDLKKLVRAQRIAFNGKLPKVLARCPECDLPTRFMTTTVVLASAPCGTCGQALTTDGGVVLGGSDGIQPGGIGAASAMGIS